MSYPISKREFGNLNQDDIIDPDGPELESSADATPSDTPAMKSRQQILSERVAITAVRYGSSETARSASPARQETSVTEKQGILPDASTRSGAFARSGEIADVLRRRDTGLRPLAANVSDLLPPEDDQTFIYMGEDTNDDFTIEPPDENTDVWADCDSGVSALQVTRGSGASQYYAAEVVLLIAKLIKVEILAPDLVDWKKEKNRSMYKLAQAFISNRPDITKEIAKVTTL